LQYSEDKFLALEAAAFRTGVFIYVPKNTSLDNTPLRIITSLGNDATSSVSQNIIIADAGSKATVVQEIYSPSYTEALPGEVEKTKPEYTARIF
jgi:Fe-S cluster assembly scaffold protein SufB